jgi:RHS repeat-associated protein
LFIFAPEFDDPMNAQKPIAKSPISDAFFSKNVTENYWANGCFCARCRNITGFTFTGKEKDPETGYSYFGARYLDHELMTMWLSVDPMADKYPSISPYAYCVWNPVKLVDPKGKEVEYSSFRDWFYVLTQRMFNKGFRLRYKDLRDSKEVYVFNNNDKGENKLTFNNEKIFINYSLGENEKKEKATVFSLLRHETEHAVQFEYGEVGFVRDDSGKWRSLNYDIYDELKARDFEASSFIILNPQSIYGRWGSEGSALETREQQIDFLKNNCNFKSSEILLDNRQEDVDGDETRYALPHRNRTYK